MLSLTSAITWAFGLFSTILSFQVALAVLGSIASAFPCFGFTLLLGNFIMAMKSSAKKTENKKNDKNDKKGQEPFFRTVAENRRARHDYEILEKHEAGVSLFGTEVKSIRLGKASLQEAYVKIEAGEVWLYNCNIAHYEWGNRNNHEPARKRRLLMHDREILRLKAQVQEKGLTLIPLRLYFKGNLIKCEVALGKGRKLYDKRETIAKKDTKRQLDRLMKQSGR